MKIIRMFLGSTLFIVLFIHASLSLAQVERVNINGTVTFNDTPVVAMVLANGQYMFTGGDTPGFYDLEVPLNQNGQITLYCFVSGFAPYKEVLTPSGDVTTRNIQMVRSDRTRLPQVVLLSKWPSEEYPNRTNITGNVSFNNESVCSLMIANGQSTFTCDGDGRFELDVPLDADGNITLQCFISGFSPYRLKFNSDSVMSPIVLDPTFLLNQNLLGEWLFEYTINPTYQHTYVLDRLRQAPLDVNLEYGLSSIASGTNEYDDTVYAYYIPLYDLYYLEDLVGVSEGNPMVNVFRFYFYTDNVVLGIFYEIDQLTGVAGEPYPMTGSRLAGP